MYQDLYQAQGYKHYMGTPKADDSLLHDLYIDRIYDAYVDEIGFVKTDDVVAEIASSMPPRKYSTREFMLHLGDRAKSDPNSIVGTAAKRGVPDFRSRDSGLINRNWTGRTLPRRKEKPQAIDATRYYPRQLRDRTDCSKVEEDGSIYIGGGVPKNYINDAAVMLDYTPGHAYVFQITTDAPHWGGLTGSTLDEAKSWGKVSKRATRATAYVEATIGLPLVAGYVLSSRELLQNRKRMEFVWESDELKRLTLSDSGSGVGSLFAALTVSQ